MLKRLLQSFFFFFNYNQSTTVLTKNLDFHRRSKHIDITFHYILELVKDKEFTHLKFCSKKLNYRHPYKTNQGETIAQVEKMMYTTKFRVLGLDEVLYRES